MFWSNRHEKKPEKEWICEKQSLCCTPETNTVLKIHYNRIKIVLIYLAPILPVHSIMSLPWLKLSGSSAKDLSCSHTRLLNWPMVLSFSLIHSLPAPSFLSIPGHPLEKKQQSLCIAFLSAWNPLPSGNPEVGAFTLPSSLLKGYHFICKYHHHSS